MLVIDALYQAAGPLFVHLRQSGTLVVGLIGEASPTTVTLPPADVLSVADGGYDTDFAPPSRVLVRYAPVATTQSAPLATATASRAALIQAPHRVSNKPIRTNRVRYADDDFPAGRVLESTSSYRNLPAARLEAKRLATTWRNPRPLYDVKVRGGYRSSYELGDVVAYTDPTTGSSGTGVLVGIEQSPTVDTLTLR